VVEERPSNCALVFRSSGLEPLRRTLRPVGVAVPGIECGIEMAKCAEAVALLTAPARSWVVLVKVVLPQARIVRCRHEADERVEGRNGVAGALSLSSPQEPPAVVWRESLLATSWSYQ